jgi:hypothetical protein
MARSIHRSDISRFAPRLQRLIDFSASRLGARLFSFVDNSLASICNFIVTLALLHNFSQTDFGGYGVGLLISLTFASTYRSSFVVPAALLSDRLFRLRRSGLLGQHLMIVVGVGALQLSTLLVSCIASLGALSHAILLGLFATMPSFISVDIDRLLLMRGVHPLGALLVSSAQSAFVLAVVGAVVILKIPFDIAAIALGCGGLLKIFLAAWLSGPPNFKHAIKLWRRLLATSLGWNSLGTLASSGYTGGPLWVLSAIGAAQNVAAFSAVRAPLQPAMIVIRSLDLVDKVAMGSASLADSRAQWRQARLTYLLYLLTSGLLAVVVWVNADLIIDLMLGHAYAPFSWTLRLTSLLFLLIASTPPLESLVYKAGLYRPYALLQLAGGIAAMLTAVPLSIWLADIGAVIASVLGWSIPYIYALALLLRQRPKPVNPCA